MMLSLSEEQQKYVNGLANQLAPDQRETFLGAVKFRLSGRPADETLHRVVSLI
jgi:hypothetical protein